MADPPRIGRYEIKSPLGAGGMGRVYLAHDSLLRRDVALKLPLDAATPEAAARLLREARAASALNHSGICHIYDVGESDSGPWIAMELVPGKPLSARIPRGGLPFETTVHFARQLSAALQHAHQRGLVHRDLKPSNIVLTSDDTLKILDFGLARHSPATLEHLTTLTAIPDDKAIGGTPAYMAPEVIRGQEADQRSDLWALGVVLYEMSEGVRPFAGRTPMELVSAILTETPRPLRAGTPQAFAAIAFKLLEKDPQRRYQSAVEVLAALDVTPAAVVTASESTKAVPRVPRLLRRWVTLSALSAVVVAAIVFWMARDQPLVLTEIQPLTGPGVAQTAPTFSPDGSQLAFAAPDADGIAQVWIRTLTEPNAVQLTSDKRPASRPRWHPNGGSIIYAQRGGGIWTISPVGGTSRRLVEVGANPNLSQDGEWLTWEQGEDIWISRADGSQPHAVNGIPARFYGVPRLPSLSPDGTRIVYFQSALGPNGDFWEIPATGGKPRQLTSDLRPGGASAWTPDGRHIVFSSGRAGTRALWQIRADGGGLAPVTTGAGEDDWPAISNDGLRVAFANSRNSWDLRLLDEHGRERVLLSRPREILFPRFSPDGTKISFFGTAGSAVAVFTVAIDGTDERQLTAGRELNHMPRWSPDGEYVYFYQSAPATGVRRVAAVGGQQSAILPFEWERQNWVDFSPRGTTVVYTLLTAGSPDITVFRDLRTGEEHRMADNQLHAPRFSRDGAHVGGSRRERDVAICSVAGWKCRSVAKTDFLTPVAWSGDDSRLYFLRGADRTGMQDVWSVAVDGTDERRHAAIGPFRGIDRFFDVSPSGQITWSPYTAGRSELWLATVK